MPESQRLMLALAGAPGSGKSTLAEKLVALLNDNPSLQCSAAAVPMDGFHLDNAILESRNQLSIKGSPATFDVDGFHDLLLRLRRPVSAQQTHGSPFADSVYFPLFDRGMDLARVAAGCVDSGCGIVVVEGNYLLLQRIDWQVLRACFDVTVMLDVPMDELERRLIQRWLDHGLEAEEARTRALSNDIPNALVVLEESTAADVQFHSVRQ